MKITDISSPAMSNFGQLIFDNGHMLLFCVCKTAFSPAFYNLALTLINMQYKIIINCLDFQRKAIVCDKVSLLLQFDKFFCTKTQENEFDLFGT
jgi:hypothetical protein